MVKRLLILKFGPASPTFIRKHGDFEDLFIEQMQIGKSDFEVLDPSQGDDLPDPADYAGVLLMGSHANVTDGFEWIERVSEWIRSVHNAGTPMLGVCFGHQLLNHALGGVSGDNPNGREFGTVEITTTEAAKQNRLFDGLPGAFPAQVSHAQSALALPSGAVRLASSEKEPNQAFHLPPASWGVQFHPEFDASVSSFLVQEFADALRSEGQNVERLLQEAREAAESVTILKNFKQIIEANA